MTTRARLYPYLNTKECPKCGAWCMYLPKFHARGGGWILWVTGPWNWLHKCPGFDLDHLHFHCGACQARFAVACRDIKEAV